ncbi:MAG: kelch repeat-containing protein [Polyangia bacterium]
MRVSLLLLVCAAGCREPYTPLPTTTDMTPALPTVVWKKRTDAPGSVPRADMPIVIAPEQRALFGFGGMPLTQTDAWSFSLLDDSWSVVPLGTTNPPGRDGHCAAYLPVQTQVLFVGGHGRDATPPASRLLAVGNDAYSPVTGDRPAAGDGCAAAYLSRTHGVVVYGGSSTPDETWLFDGTTSTYTQQLPDNTPGGRVGASLIEDPGVASDAGVTDFVILYGGLENGVESTDVWIYNGTVWAELGTSADPVASDTDDPRPLGRTQAAVALDSTRHLLYVFGGLRQGAYLADLWVLDLSTTTWHRLPIGGGPVGRAGASVAWDTVLDRMLLFGGKGDAGLLSDGWTLSVAP